MMVQIEVINVGMVAILGVITGFCFHWAADQGKAREALAALNLPEPEVVERFNAAKEGSMTFTANEFNYLSDINYIESREDKRGPLLPGATAETLCLIVEGLDSLRAGVHTSEQHDAALRGLWGACGWPIWEGSGELAIEAATPKERP